MSASGNYRQLIMCDSVSLSLRQHCALHRVSRNDKGETAFIKYAAPGSELPSDKQHVAVLWLTLP